MNKLYRLLCIPVLIYLYHGIDVSVFRPDMIRHKRSYCHPNWVRSRRISQEEIESKFLIKTHGQDVGPFAYEESRSLNG